MHIHISHCDLHILHCVSLCTFTAYAYEVIVTDTVKKSVDRVHQEPLSSRNMHRQTGRHGLPAGGVKQHLEQYLCVRC